MLTQSEKNARQYHKHREKILQKHKERRSAPDYLKRFHEYQEKMRIGAIIVLGGKCVKCGYDDNIDGLEIDHIKPVLNTKRGTGAGVKFYHDVIDGKRDNLQVLCGTCHRIKTKSETSLWNYERRGVKSIS